MKILSSFTHPHVVLNLYDFLSFVEHKLIYSEEGFNSRWQLMTELLGELSF